MMNVEDDYSINFTDRKAPAVVVAVEAGVAAHLMLKISLSLQWLQ
jgi:hypothetical protein